VCSAVIQSGAGVTQAALPYVDAAEIIFNILIAGYAQLTGSTDGFYVIFDMINVGKTTNSAVTP
jgi:hypothetical protein